MKDCLVEDTGPLNKASPQAVSYIQLVHYTDKANPIVIYELNQGDNSTIRSAAWIGKSWVYSDVPTEGFILDMEKTGSESFSFYAGQGQILAYSTQDAGQNWQFDYSFSLPDNKRVLKLNVIDDYKEPAHFLITEATSSSFPSANVFIAGKATCLQTGKVQIISPEGDFLSISNNKLALTDAMGRASQWRIGDQAGYCILQNEEANQTLNLQDDKEAEWLIIGADNGQVQLQEVSSGLYLKTDLSFGREDEMTYWTLEPIN
jgi:hypothetical protein